MSQEQRFTLNPTDAAIALSRGHLLRGLENINNITIR